MTRRQSLTGLAGILAAGVAPAAVVRSMLGARGVAMFAVGSGGVRNVGLCFVAEQENSTICLNKIGSVSDAVLICSYDGDNWSDFIIGNTYALPTVGSTFYLKAKYASAFPGGNSLNENANQHNFVMTGTVSAYNSIMWLEDPTGESLTCAGRFAYLFKNCSSLLKAPLFPATVGTSGCYGGLFLNCSNLVEVQDTIPLTTDPGWYSCESMFRSCTSLLKAPRIVMNSLNGALYRAFMGCTSLVDAGPEIPPSNSAWGCNSTFMNCTSLRRAPSLRLDSSGRGNRYFSMFRGCTSLQSAPELPGMLLENECYAFMFHGCSSITEAPILPALNLSYNCYQWMLSGTSIESAPELPSENLAERCYSQMFAYCNSLRTVTLPARNLTTKCYVQMFYGCKNLTINTMQGDFSGCDEWLAGTTAGTFRCRTDLDIPSDRSSNNVPNNWTIEKVYT